MINKINKGEDSKNSMVKFEVLKGTKDALFNEQIKINEIVDIIKRNFEKYGFRPFDTPIIEFRDTLTNKYDDKDEIVQEIFDVKDRGKRSLGLRYDLTIPLCRYIASQKQLKLPFKRYAIGKVFRDGPIKSGRMREFMQCDADVVGISEVPAEAETLKMFYDTYKKIGIDAVLEINNNKILRGALLQVGFKEKELQKLILSIDKLKKVGESGVLDEIKSKKLDTKMAKDGLKLLSMNLEDLDKIAKDDLLKEGIKELSILIYLLETMKVKYRINLSMSRGLNIYTGNIWEAFDSNPKTKVKSSIGSGGRYDNAIGNYIGDGREFPAFGVSFGLVPMIECLDVSNEISLTNVIIAPLEKEVVEDAIQIAQTLREDGKNVEICYDLKLKKAFDYADFVNADELIVLGSRDIKNKEYTVKNLKTKKETKVKL